MPLHIFLGFEVITDELNDTLITVNWAASETVTKRQICVYVHIYVHVCMWELTYVYAKYACIIRVCDTWVYLSITVEAFEQVKNVYKFFFHKSVHTQSIK